MSDNITKEKKLKVHLDNDTTIEADSVVGFIGNNKEPMVSIDGKQYHERHIVHIEPIKKLSPSEIAAEFKAQAAVEIKAALKSPTDF